jgi:hypothetical protein
MWVNFQKEINRFIRTHFAHLVSICQTLCNTRNAKASPSKGICLSVSRQVSQTTREQINYPRPNLTHTFLLLGDTEDKDCDEIRSFF